MIVNSTLLKDCCYECGEFVVENNNPATETEAALENHEDKKARLDNTVKKIVTLFSCEECQNALYCSKVCQNNALTHHKKICVKDKALNIDLVRNTLANIIDSDKEMNEALSQHYCMVWLETDANGAIKEKSGYYKLAKPPLFVLRDTEKKDTYVSGMAKLIAENTEVLGIDVSCVNMAEWKTIADPRYQGGYLFIHSKG